VGLVRSPVGDGVGGTALGVGAGVAVPPTVGTTVGLAVGTTVGLAVGGCGADRGGAAAPLSEKPSEGT